jgi:cell division protein FtsB
MKFTFKTIVLFILLGIITIVFAKYVADLLFLGKNSYETYDSLKTKKVQLEDKIKLIQISNAKLQKDYFELKNLEPEQ